VHGRFGGDVSMPLLGVDRRVEVKCRGNGFRRLYDWLGDADFLMVRSDRREPLVVLPLRLAAEVAAVAESNRALDHWRSVRSVAPKGSRPAGQDHEELSHG
jgi:hypothetical protein